MTDDHSQDPVDSTAPAATVETPPPAPSGKAPPETPGSLIRAARAKADLSLDELAGQTRLARPTLEALERDDFAALLEPVYVRGYYRKVAKILNMPEAPLIKAYEMRVVPRAILPPAKLRLGTGADLDGGRRLGGVLIIALFAVLAGIVIWYVRGGPATKGPTLLPPQAAVTSSTEAGIVPNEPVPADVPPAASVPAPTAETAAPAVAAAAAPQAQLGTAVATGVQLQLNFVSISWARVEDANGRVLLNRVVQAGERQVLDGLPPYTVFLGNAPGVQVQYQGAALDIKPLTRDNATARFKVPLPQP